MNGPFTISPQQNTSSIQINDKINFTLNLINPLLSSNQLKINNTNSINKFPIFNYFDVNYFNFLFQNYKHLISSNQNLTKSNINNKEVESRKNNYFLVGKKKKEIVNYAKIVLILLLLIMRKECVRIVIILKEEVRNLGIVFMLIKHIML